MSESFNENLAAFGTNLIGRTACRRTARVVGHRDSENFGINAIVCRVGRSEYRRQRNVAHLSERGLALESPSRRKRDIIGRMSYADGEVCRFARCIIGSKVACRLSEGHRELLCFCFVEIGYRRRNGIAYLTCAVCGNHAVCIHACVTACDRIGECACVTANAHCEALLPSRCARSSRYGQGLRALIQRNREGFACRIVVIACRLIHRQGKGAACLRDIRYNAICKVKLYAVLIRYLKGERSIACATDKTV